MIANSRNTRYLLKRSFHFSAVVHSDHAAGAKIKKERNEVQRLVSPLTHASTSTLRNVGVIAHIDAGKTTTTERMVYYAGITDELGNVDKGTTTTDFLEQERLRGITIQSSAVSFHWSKHRVTLIDTPGHIDFTMEVERTLRVVDGAVGILDASAGVEAQTKTVWRQADRYQIPRIVFLNKMDKTGANIANCLSSLRKQLKITPLLTQVSLGLEKDFEGVVDLASLNKMTWARNAIEKTFSSTSICKADGDFGRDVIESRNQLIDQLAELDPLMMGTVLAVTSHDDISADAIRASLRRVTYAHKAVPVLFGSALRNCAVQPLLDAMVDYLPNPQEALHVFGKEFGEELCALVFKIIHSKERGMVAFVRIYSGSLRSSMSLYNASQEGSEKLGKLFVVLADQLVEVKSAGPGSIVAVTGLTKVVTGDTLVTSAAALKRTEKLLGEALVLPSISLPQPVFMCSVEPYSSRQQKQLDDALACLVREDPSLRVKSDTESDQVLLFGMGELHLEIIKDRLLKDYGLEVYMGTMRIAYRETIEKSSPVNINTVDRLVGDIHHHVTVSLSIVPRQGALAKETLFVRSEKQDWSALHWSQRKAIINGIQSAMSSGPLLGFPVVDVEVQMHSFELHSYKTSAPMISAAVYECLHKAMLMSGVVLREPVVRLEIHCAEEYTGAVLGDLSQRRSVIESVCHNSDDEATKVTAQSPVAMLLGYSTTLRKITSGTASMMMEVNGYADMSEQDQKDVLDNFRGA